LDFEAAEHVRYFRAGMFDNPDIIRYQSLTEYKALGTAKSGDWNHLDSFLVLPESGEIRLNEVHLRKGRVAYGVSQPLNESSIYLIPGSIYGRRLVAGKIATISHDPISLKLYKTFSGLIKKRFQRIEDFYVGDKARNRLENGWRLVSSKQQPREYDLKYQQG
jgi:hypothetical protein